MRLLDIITPEDIQNWMLEMQESGKSPHEVALAARQNMEELYPMVEYFGSIGHEDVAEVGTILSYLDEAIRWKYGEKPS